jgi:peptidoglycan/LPS O-acetylase OafA/YrhL
MKPETEHFTPEQAPKPQSLLTASLTEGLSALRERPRHQEPVLDALRALAVMLVVCNHSMDWWQHAAGVELAIRLLPMIYFGWTGVDLFYILSGYLIAGQIWREVEITGTVRFGRFVLRRGFRIWPLYFAFAGVFTPLYLLGSCHVNWLREALGPLESCSSPGVLFKLSDSLFYSNYVAGVVRGSWSLSTEEQFYILLPLAVALVGPRLPLRAWIIIIIVAMTAVELARYSTASSLTSQGLPIKEVKDVMYSPGHLRCQGLLLGALIALAQKLQPSLLKPRQNRAGLLAALGIALAGTSLAVVLRTASPIILTYFSLALFYGSLTCVMMMVRQTRFLKRLGICSLNLYRMSRLSFGVYLCHFYTGKICIALAGPTLIATFGNGHLSFLLALLLVSVSAFLFSAITFVLIEHPFLKIRERTLKLRVFSRSYSSEPVASV